MPSGITASVLPAVDTIRYLDAASLIGRTSDLAPRDLAFSAARVNMDSRSFAPIDLSASVPEARFASAQEPGLSGWLGGPPNASVTFLAFYSPRAMRATSG